MESLPKYLATMDPLSIGSAILGLVAASSDGISKLHNTLGHDVDSLAKVQPQLIKFQTATTLL